MEKRIHKKRKYSRPQLEVIDVDHEISLVMLSVGNPPGLEAMEAPSSDASSPLDNLGGELNQDNPFGGSSPDYSN